MDNSGSSNNGLKAADVEKVMRRSTGLTVADITCGDPDSEFKSKNPLTALVVDNSDTRRKVNVKLLVSLGVECWETDDGSNAVELTEFGISFDLIIMDKDLPILDGPSTAKMLRGMGVRCMIIGVSPEILDESEKYQFMMSGIDECEDKPLTRAKLLSVLRAIDEDHRLSPSWKSNK